jgi:hypothetical protein
MCCSWESLVRSADAPGGKLTKLGKAMQSTSWYRRPAVLIGGFAVLNVAMYLLIRKFWIGGSSFLPLIGKTGKPGAPNAFVFALIVNVGVIAGSMLGAAVSGEFRLRWPRREGLGRMLLGGVLIGTGVTLCPGTCTTAFVTGLPMLSVSSILSAAGIFLGGFAAYSLMMRGGGG